MIKKLLFLLFLPIAAFSVSCSDTQIFTLTIHGICDIVITPSTFSFALDTGQDGEIMPNTLTAEYDIVNSSNSSAAITGQLDADMPTDTELAVDTTAPPFGGTGTVDIALSQTAANLVTGIPLGGASGIAMTFIFLTTSETPPVSQSFVRTFTMTLLEP